MRRTTFTPCELASPTALSAGLTARPSSGSGLDPTATTTNSSDRESGIRRTSSFRLGDDPPEAPSGAHSDDADQPFLSRAGKPAIALSITAGDTLRFLTELA